MADESIQPLPPGTQFLQKVSPVSSSDNVTSRPTTDQGNSFFPLSHSNVHTSSPSQTFHQQNILTSNSNNLQFNIPVSQAFRAAASESAILQPHEISNGSSSQFGRSNDIETAAQNAVLREQEISTRKIIQSQRESITATVPSEDGKDLLSGRHDPNALKEHLLKMTSQHRMEMALKRGKPMLAEEG